MNTQPVTKDFGPTDEKITVTMTSVTDHEGIYITTVAGGGHNSTLSRNFPHAEVASARIFYGHIKDAAKAGKAVYQIEAEISALIEAIEATSRTPDKVAESLKADGTAYLAAATAAHNRVVQIRDEVMADADPNWRANLRKQVVQAAQQANQPRVGQSTAAPTSEPMDRILAEAANGNGYIPRSKQATSVQLIALDKRGLVDLVYGQRGNTRVITGAVLTSKGSKGGSRMTQPFETPARMVRTGQVIKTPNDGYRLSLEVEIVHHELREADGEKVPAVWFTGWASNGQAVERGWGHLPDTLVLVVEDRRGNCFGTLTGQIDTWEPQA